MPKLYTYRSAGYDLASYGPESVEEYDQKAGGPGKCLEDAVSNEIYRGTIPDVWPKALPKIAELTGIPVGVDEKATAKAKERAKEGATVKDVPEKFTSYLNRVEAQFHEDKETLEQINQIIKQAALDTPIDPSPSNRAKGPGKDYLDKADTILALPDDQLEARVAKWLGLAGDFELLRDDDGKPNRDSLARLAKAATDALLA